MGVSFLTPVAALFGLLAAVPLAVFAGRRRRAAQVRAALRLEPLPRRPWGLLAACLAAVPVLVGVAAAQPVITSARTVPQRSDAEVFIVLDTSRSMLASSSSGEPTRFERARDDALALQAELPGIPVGIASLTDRVLPHLFPTVDRRVFGETMREAVGIERPPPSTSFGTNVTTLDALGAVPTLNFFTPSGKAPRARRLHRRRERAGDERAVDRLRAHAAHRRHARSRRRRGRADLRVRSRGGGIHAQSGRGDVARRPPRRSRADACSRRGRSARWQPPSARRSPRAPPSTGESRATAGRSCRTSRCWRSSRSASCSTGAISESG